jgi:hypothetical protein
MRTTGGSSGVMIKIRPSSATTNRPSGNQNAASNPRCTRRTPYVEEGPGSTVGVGEDDRDVTRRRVRRGGKTRAISAHRRSRSQVGRGRRLGIGNVGHGARAHVDQLLPSRRTFRPGGSVIRNIVTLAASTSTSSPTTTRWPSSPRPTRRWPRRRSSGVRSGAPGGSGTTRCADRRAQRAGWAARRQS